MEVNEAIAKLHKEIIIDFGSFSYIKLSQDEAKSIIALLQQGKAYRQMWKELSEKYGNYWSAFDVRKGNDVEYKYIDDLMQPIEQKYFPKEAKQDESDEPKDNRK